MTGDDFLKSLLALQAYRDGYSEGLSGMKAIAYVFRNRVRAGWFGGVWHEILAHANESSYTVAPPSTEIPDPRNYAFRSLLQEIDGIFNGSSPDTITVAQDPLSNSLSLAAPPRPALYYGYMNKIDREWFLTEISRNSIHQRIAQCGALTFWN